MSTPSENVPAGKPLETAIRTALMEEEQLYHNLKNQRQARKRKLNDTRSSIDWLSSALEVTQGVLDSSTDVVSVLRSFVDNLHSVISLHGSDRISGDLKRSLPSTNPAKRTWESAADKVDNLLVQIESLKSTTSSHHKSIGTELEAQKRIDEQSQISLDSLTQSIVALTHSINQKRSILCPIHRVPTEILGRIFELATLDERLALLGELGCRKAAHIAKNDIYCTIPRIPTILASTCRRWRAIALNMALLWSFLRIPTLERYQCTTVPRSCVVGLSTFQRAKSCIGASKCEVVVGPTTDWSMVINYLSSISVSQISTMNIVSPPDWLDLSQFPTARVLCIFGKHYSSTYTAGLSPLYFLPPSVLADTRELSCHDALPAVDASIPSVTSLSLSLKSKAYFPDLCLPLVNFPNLTAVVISANVHILHPQDIFTPLHHARIETLSITDSVIPHLCAALQQGALSLPSLTHFILLDIFPSGNNDRGEWSQLQSLFVNVTCFEIRAATQQNCGSNIRQLLDDMPLLQQFTLCGDAVNDGLGALLIAPMKQIRKLVVSDTKADGSNVKSYYDALRSESAPGPDDKPDISIQFVNSPSILPQIREQLPS